MAKLGVAFLLVFTGSTFLTNCASMPPPAPYIEETLKDLKKQTSVFYDGLIGAPNTTDCQYSSSKFWGNAERALRIIRYRVAARSEDAILIEPIATLADTFASYQDAHKAAEKKPAPQPGTDHNPKCLTPAIAAHNSIVLEDRIDQILILQQKRKDAAK